MVALEVPLDPIFIISLPTPHRSEISKALRKHHRPFDKSYFNNHIYLNFPLHKWFPSCNLNISFSLISKRIWFPLIDFYMFWSVSRPTYDVGKQGQFINKGFSSSQSPFSLAWFISSKIGRENVFLEAVTLHSHPFCNALVNQENDFESNQNISSTTLILVMHYSWLFG